MVEFRVNTNCNLHHFTFKAYFCGAVRAIYSYSTTLEIYYALRFAILLLQTVNTYSMPKAFYLMKLH